MIPFLDFKDLNAPHREELIKTIEAVIDSGYYILGSKVEAFERELAKYCGVKEVIGTGNGLDALTLILRAYKDMKHWEDGDEILVQANTYIASILAITENRLTPVLVEPDIHTFNIDPKLIEEFLKKQ